MNPDLFTFNPQDAYKPLPEGKIGLRGLVDYRDPMQANTYTGGVNAYGEKLPGYSTIPVTSEYLNPPTDLSKNLSYPNSSVPDVSYLDKLYTPTPEESRVDKTITDLGALYDQGTGESAARLQAEQAQGLPGLRKTQNDLLAQQQAILNEQAQIQLTKPGPGQGGLPTIQIERQQAEKLRQNAVSALSISSLLAASNGQIATANDLVDRAVRAQFDPIKAKIDAATNNLNLLLKSPGLSLAEKKRAAQQLEIQNQKSRDIEKHKEDAKTIMSWAAAALRNGASTFQAQQISNVANSGTPDLQAAFNLYAPFAKDPNATQKAVLELEKMRADIANTKADTAKKYSDNQVLTIKDAQALGVPYGTTKAQAIALGKVPGVSAEAASLKTNALSSATELLNKFNAGQGTSAVGGNILNRLGPVGDFLGMGTSRSDFIVQLNNLKSLLSLDNVKLLKGQGQVSDAERRLLEQASAKLDRSQSEPEFKAALQNVIKALSGGTNEDIQIVNGVTYKKAADGLYYPQ